MNAQNIYGAGPLHELIKNKRENLAVWLIKHGADIYMEDKRTYSPYDLALPWFQKDMKKIAADVDITKRYEVNEATQTTYSLTKNHTEEKPQGQFRGAVLPSKPSTTCLNRRHDRDAGENLLPKRFLQDSVCGARLDCSHPD